MNKNLICIDTECAKYPNNFGLNPNILSRKDCIFEHSAQDARNIAKTLPWNSKVIVVSSDDIDAINLAAAIKQDKAKTNVVLVVNKPTGSLKSRADACNINKVIEMDDLDFELDDVNTCESYNIHENSYSNEAISGVENENEEKLDFVGEPLNQNIENNNQNCWIMSVFSGSGGAGKSAVSAVSAQLLSSLGFRTLLVDCDLQFGDIKNAFKKANSVQIEQVIEKPEKIADFSENCNESPFVLCSPENLESCELATSKINDVLRVASSAFDTVVVNTGSCWSDVHVDLMRNSSLSLFLIDQRVSSVRGCKHALELAERLNISSQSFKFALNRCSKRSVLSSADVCPTLGSNEIYELADGELEVEEKMCLGCASDLIKRRNPFSVSVFEMLKTTCPLSIPTTKRRKASSLGRAK